MKRLPLFMCLLLSCLAKPKYNNPTDNGVGLLTNFFQNFSTANTVTNTFALRDTVKELNEGTKHTVYVRLAVKPSSTQTVTITSNHPAIEVNDASSATLTFTPEIATIEQSFTLSALIDGNEVTEEATVTLSAPGIETTPLSVKNVDVKGDWVSVETPTSITEDGTGTTRIQLSQKPHETVTVNVSSSYTGLSVDKTSLSFTAQDWNVAQTINLTGSADTNKDSETVLVSASMTGSNITTKSITYQEYTIIISFNITTIKEGSSTTCTVKLDRAPAKDVTVSLSSFYSSKHILSLSSLTFTPSNYSTEQTVTVSVNKDTDGFSEPGSIVASSVNTNTKQLSFYTLDEDFKLGLLKTGQTTSHAAGDDGAHQKTTARSYTDNGDGTVTDNATGLIWQQGEGGAMNWDSAISYCNALSLAGKTWKLPSIQELSSLVDATKSSLTINTGVFPSAVANLYWSSTTFASNTTYAWYVLFSVGDVSSVHRSKSVGFYVRCVSGL
ncbi:MAG: DUF1566 domain-containing protein [Leptospiraceae bacterium]|nr:DUF1566 domain-containing protein [Leptospiraceae bacterium]MCP5501122.1 DUF1566 domain-containing protein [Leptospiraceae bacterium]